VVLAHGYTATLGYRNIVRDALLERGHRVIAFDRRGHGGSTLGSAGIGSEPMADDYAAVLDHFDVRDAVLIGHSMGGFVAIRAVLDHPELVQRLRGLVLFATWAALILDGAPQNRLQLPLLQSGILPRLARSRTGGLLFGAFQRATRPSPAVIAVFREMFVQHMEDHGPLLPRSCTPSGVRTATRGWPRSRCRPLSWWVLPIAPRRQATRGGSPQGYPTPGTC
jgi:pimeloyl-ACP methyl ester carboxylesterase